MTEASPTRALNTGLDFGQGRLSTSKDLYFYGYVPEIEGEHSSFKTIHQSNCIGSRKQDQINSSTYDILLLHKSQRRLYTSSPFIDTGSATTSKSGILLGRMRNRRSIPSIRLPSASTLVSSRDRRGGDLLGQERQLPPIPDPSL